MRGDGSVFRRGKKGIVWIAWCDKDGEHRESTHSTDERAGAALLRKRLTGKDKGEVYVPPSSKRVTVGQLVEMYLEEHRIKGTKSIRRFEQHGRNLLRQFGRETAADTIDYDELQGYVKARRRVAKPATVRAELRCLAAAFKVARRRARNLRELGYQPLTAPEFPTVTVKNVRKLKFTTAELTALLEHLPPPIAAVVRFASMTGWRLMECLNLRWTAIDFEAGTITLEPGETKSGEGRTFPFAVSPRLAELLEAQRQERWRVERKRGVEVTHVFHRDGRPIRNIDDAWKAACLKAELVDGSGKHTRIFHDLRRYAAMRLVQAGVAQSDAMALLGHSTPSMFLRYALKDLPTLERAVKQLAALDEPAEAE